MALDTHLSRYLLELYRRLSSSSAEEEGRGIESKESRGESSIRYAKKLSYHQCGTAQETK